MVPQRFGFDLLRGLPQFLLVFSQLEVIVKRETTNNPCHVFPGESCGLSNTKTTFEKLETTQ